MNEWILISIFFIILFIIIGIIITLIFFKKKENGRINKEIDYKAFYLIGIIWIPVGIVFMITINLTIGIASIGMGTAYMAIGLSNRDKWERKNED
jgi:hypothetical protein